MDLSYNRPRSSGNFVLPIFIIVIIIFFVGGLFVFFRNRVSLVSPIPEVAEVEIIFFTPTPQPLTPTSSPSATPKVATPTKKAPTATPQEAASPTVQPTSGATATPTP